MPNKHKPYQGFQSWNAWNVSLWLGGDEGLYRLCMNHLKYSKSKAAAARAIHADLASRGLTKTPDGAPFTITSIRIFLKGLE